MSIELAVDDRRDGIEEGERVRARELRDGLGERRRGEGAGGDDDVVPLRGRQCRHLLAADVDQRMGGKLRGHGRRETLAVDRERAAGRHLVGVGRAQDQRAEPAHLLVQETNGIVLLVVGAERVRADELCQRRGLVGGGGTLRAHLVEDDRDAARRDLPSGLGAGEPAADDVRWLEALVSHGT